MRDFAAIASLLHSLTKKEVVFHWSPECHEAFTSLKHLLTMSPSRHSQFQPALSVVYQCLDLRLGCHLATGARRERKDHLLCLPSSVTDRRTTQPPSWNGWLLCGQLPSCVSTSWRISSISIQTTMSCNGLSP